MKIALIGESGVGKDYVGDILRNRHFCRLSFSDQLKKLSTMIFPFLKRDYSPEEKEKPLNITTETGEVIKLSPREVWLALNCLRNVEDKIFIRMLAHEKNLLNCDHIFISDIRTKPEYDWCVENGFKICAIVPEDQPVHPQNDFDNFVRNVIRNGEYDFKIVNDFKGRANVEKQVESIIKEMLRGEDEDD